MTELSGPTEARSPRPGGDSPTKAKGAPGSAPPGAERKKPGLAHPTDPRAWQMWLWYAALTLLILWTWQEALRAVAIHTIPYSEFKEYLAAGQVKECDIGQDDILGRIDKSASAKPATESPTPAATASTEKGLSDDAAPDASASKKEPPPAKPDENQKPAEPKHEEKDAAKPKTESKSETKDLTEFTFRTIRVEDPKLVQELEAKGVRFEGIRPSFLSNLLWSWVIPIGVMVLLWGFLTRRLGTASQSVFGFGKSRARVVADQETGVTFADVAGCDEAKQELSEIVDFLMNPSRYEALGARIPKGVLLVGPPGTGKTLLGRAVAGEAKVPFFQLSGSDFVEMFVGVGAARVRDLFQQAKAQAPCIIFLDELDAIGRQRGVHVGAVNDEREQTLNQLLVEMDGFAPNTGVILLAATNRPEVLDRALLRPGRFDRQVVVDAPDMEGRAAILKVHSRDKRFAEGVDLRRLAQATVGFSGADLANLLNEAALLAVRRDRDRIIQADLEEAMEKVVAGPERRSRRLNETEKRRVAYHEIGHALVAAYCPNSDPLHKITIVPRGRGALGYTMHLPAEDQFLMTRSELEDRIKGLLGGRAAEDVVFGEVSTGAENDLERATDLARQMVSMYGMGDKVGLAHVGRRLGQFLSPEGTNQLDCSPETAREVDDEVRRLLEACYSAARQILTDHRADLDAAANHLLAVESIDAETFYSLIHKDAPSPTRPPVAVNPATKNVAGDGTGDSDAVPRSVR